MGGSTSVKVGTGAGSSAIQPQEVWATKPSRREGGGGDFIGAPFGDEALAGDEWGVGGHG